ncbi:hypothetical protein [Streptomyces sp. KR80]|uniref:hypothetical protein n=1 Tax=Streptomyces sp. KR80 TaxID=3457426 RepID=UPI003FD183F9
MTAPTLVSRGPRGPRGLTWSVLRVHRAPLWIWTAFVAAGIGGLLWLYRMGEEAELANGPCGTGGGLPPCGSIHDVVSDYTPLLGLAAAVIAYLPFAVAAYAGGALIGRELESGTAALAWTQSVTPARWLAAKLAVPALLFTTGTALLSLLLRWVWSSGDKALVNQWYENDFFHATGTAGVAYVLLGLAIGALAGLLMRRALPALGLAFFVTLLVYFLGDRYRSELWPKAIWTGEKAVSVPNSAQQFDLAMVTASGKRVNDLACFGTEHPSDLKKCMAQNGVTDFYAEVHPAAHYWPIQLVETGIVLALAALATAAAFWLLRRRTP